MANCYYTSEIIDKFIDVLGLNGYFLIFTVVKINLKFENYRKNTDKGKTLVIEGFGWIIGHLPSTSFMAARLVRGTVKMQTNTVLNNENICLMQN